MAGSQDGRAEELKWSHHSQVARNNRGKYEQWEFNPLAFSFFSFLHMLVRQQPPYYEIPKPLHLCDDTVTSLVFVVQAVSLETQLQQK